MEQQKITWCFNSKACTSWGTSMKRTNLAPQKKIPKKDMILYMWALSWNFVFLPSFPLPFG
jgi:hypothetical protein